MVDLDGLKLLDVYVGTKEYTPEPWVFEVSEPATGQRTYGLSPDTFVFTTSHKAFAQEVRAAMTRNPGARVSLVFRITSVYTRRKTGRGGDVTRVSFFDPSTGKRVEDVDDNDY